MEYYLVMSIGTLLLSILFLFLYFKKNTIKSVRTNLYASLIILVILFCITDIVSVYFFANNMPYLLCKFMWLFHWLICNFIFYFFVLYSVFIGNRTVVNKFIDLVKYNLITKIASISMIIQFILMIFVYPYNAVDINNIEFIYLPSIIYCAFLVICMIINIMIDIKNTTNKEKSEIIILVFSFIVFVILQVLMKNYSVISSGFLIVCFNFYFNTENPDLLLIADITKIKNKMDDNKNTKNNYIVSIADKVNLPCSLIYSLSSEINTSNYKNISNELVINSNDLLDSINSLFNMSDLDNIGESNNKTYSTSVLINNLITKANSKLSNKNVSLVLNISDSISSSLYGDDIKIYQSVCNLILNAIENTIVGKITISISSTKNDEIEELLFKVSDTGNGIKDEDKPMIFSQKTAGLGLSISKKYIESMGGSIWFDSNYHSGSNFYIKVKQKIMDSTSIGNILDNDITSFEYKDYNNKKVLLVESNELNSLLISKILNKYNIDVSCVKSAKECIYNIKNNCVYDMIFVEHELSDISGVELLHSLKSLNEYNIPPIVVVSANAILGMKDIYIKEGFNDYLALPINIKELDNILKNYLNL